MPLTTQNIESELSYAYLHAVASRAGMNCQFLNRHSDNRGIDAQIDYFGPIPNSYLTEVTIRVQLKATINYTKISDTHISYFLDNVAHYDVLRSSRGELPRILILLCLHSDENEWLNTTTDELILRESAYWVCLHGANATTNTSGTTIYFPVANLLTCDSLKDLAQELGQGNIPAYIEP